MLARDAAGDPQHRGARREHTAAPAGPQPQPLLLPGKVGTKPVAARGHSLPCHVATMACFPCVPAVVYGTLFRGR